jgi:hypothetical protein
MEGDLEPVIRLLAEHRWPWRLHATYDQTIGRALDVFEKVNRDIPLTGINWFFDHAETISDRNIDRIAALGGGIAVQHRMAYQGEYFVERYGAKAAERTPPIKKMIAAGIPWARAPMPRAWPATTRGCRCPGWSPAARWAAALYPGATASAAKRRWPCGRTRTPGFPTKWARKARSRRAAGRSGGAVGRLLQRARAPIVHPLGPDAAGRQGRAWRGRLCAARPGPAAPDARLVAGRDLRRLSQDARGARRGSPRPAAATPPAASMATIAAALGASVPAADVQTFWGALGCGCWAV